MKILSFLIGYIVAIEAFSPTYRHAVSKVHLQSSNVDTDFDTSTLQKTKDGVYICNEMPPRLPDNLKNTYYLLRHGQSWGNVEGVISSARSLATSEKHGLTSVGYEQGFNSAEDLLKLIKETNEFEDGGNPKRVFFYSSPFARARQTAEACLDGLKKNEDNKNLANELNLDINEDLIIEDGLMERFFGRLDDAPIYEYAYVWPVDSFDPCHVAFDVESVAAVSTRLRETILNIENSATHEGGGDLIVFTSHADVLQILQLYACGAENVGKFSSYRFKNGEVRLMGRTVDILPEPEPLQAPKRGT